MAIIDRRNVAIGGELKRDTSRITHIAFHYSATKEGNTKAFENHWRGTLGWSTGGYHEVILTNGDVELNYNPTIVSNGVGGQNSYIYNICYVGDGEPNDKQLKTLIDRIKYNQKRFNVPNSKVMGHREFPQQATSCPGIDPKKVRGLLSGSVTNNTSNKPKPKPKPQPKNYYQLGDSGTQVKTIQNNLIKHGYSVGRYGADGVYGDDTDKAVRAFQKANNLSVDGVAGVKTIAALKKKPKTKPKVKYPLPDKVLRFGSRGEDVKKIQRALNAANFKVGAVDGIYGAKTRDAVRRFQSVYDAYNVDGIYGARTRTRLNKKVN